MSENVSNRPFKPGEKPAPLDVDMKAGDITGWAARANVKRRRDTTSAVRTTVSVTDGPNSIATYLWHADDFALPGVWDIEVWVGNGTNRYASLTFTYEVEAAVGDAPNI